MRGLLAARRVLLAALSCEALLVTSGLALAPPKPVLEKDPRFAVVGDHVIPIEDDQKVLVAGFDRPKRLASHLGDRAQAINLARLLATTPSDDASSSDDTSKSDDVAPNAGTKSDESGIDDDAERDAWVEKLVTRIRAADAVVIDERHRPRKGPRDESARQGETPERCRALVTDWVVAVGTPVIVVRDLGPGSSEQQGASDDDAPARAGGGPERRADESGPDGAGPDDSEQDEAEPDDDEPGAGAEDVPGAAGAPNEPDVVHVLVAKVDDADVAAVLSGAVRAAGTVPELDEQQATADAQRGDDDVPEDPQRADDDVPECPALPEIPEPDPAPTPAPEPDPAPAPEPSPSPTPEPSADPVPDPETTSPPPDAVPTPEPSPSPDPGPTPGPIPEPSPSPDPGLTPDPGPVPDPDPTPGPRPSPAPDPAPEPRTPAPAPRDPSDRTPWRLPAPDHDGLALTVPTGGVDLDDVTIDDDRLVLTGALARILVRDGRSGSHHGWTLSAQVSDLRGPATLPASHLGWIPHVRDERAQAGPAVVGELSGGLGLAAPAVLASAPGSTPGKPVRLGADLVLETPRDVTPGSYSGVITLTLFPSE